MQQANSLKVKTIKVHSKRNKYNMTTLINIKELNSQLNFFQERKYQAQ